MLVQNNKSKSNNQQELVVSTKNFGRFISHDKMKWCYSWWWWNYGSWRHCKWENDNIVEAVMCVVDARWGTCQQEEHGQPTRHFFFPLLFCEKPGLKVNRIGRLEHINRYLHHWKIVSKILSWRSVWKGHKAGCGTLKKLRRDVKS